MRKGGPEAGMGDQLSIRHMRSKEAGLTWRWCGYGWCLKAAEPYGDFTEESESFQRLHSVSGISASGFPEGPPGLGAAGTRG